MFCMRPQQSQNLHQKRLTFEDSLVTELQYSNQILYEQIFVIFCILAKRLDIPEKTNNWWIFQPFFQLLPIKIIATSLMC